MKTYENLRNLADLQAHTANVTKAVEQANQVFETAKELFKKWDGKMLNKRFANQLQYLFPETITGSHADFRGDMQPYTRKKISIYYGQDWGDKKFSISLYPCGYDVEQEIHTDFRFQKPNRYCNGVITSGDRINAEEAIKALQTLIDRNNEIVWRYNDAIKNWDKYLNAYNAALENLWATIRQINPYFVPNQISTYQAGKSELEEMMYKELQKD